MADKNVLIYEKDDKFVKALKLYFRGSPWDPVSVESEGGITPAARERRPDAILIAIEANDAESQGLIRGLHDEGATRGVPIVVMSSKKDDRELFGDAVTTVGASAYIKKPFIKKAILQLLDDVMTGVPPAPPAAGAAKPRSGVDLGSVFSDMDRQIDTFFEKEPAQKEEFALTLEDEGSTTETDRSAVSGPFSAPVDDSVAPTPSAHEVSAEHHVDSRSGRDDHPVYDAAELKRLRERIRELETELRSKSEEFKSVAREKEKLEHSVGRKESELIDKIRGLEKQNEELEEDVKKRKQLVQQMTASVQQLNDDLEEKDRKHGKEIESWQTQLSKLQSQFDELQEKSSAQSHDIEDKTDEIARQKRRLEDLEGERNELQTNLERMTEAKAEADRQIETLDSDLRGTRETLATTQGELSTERSRIAAGREHFERGTAALRETLERDMAEARSIIERGLEQARTAIEQGLGHSKETVERTAATAQETLDKGIGHLSGNT